jgi:hypothetical protein
MSEATTKFGSVLVASIAAIGSASADTAHRALDPSFKLPASFGLDEVQATSTRSLVAPMLGAVEGLGLPADARVASMGPENQRALTINFGPLASDLRRLVTPGAPIADVIKALGPPKSEIAIDNDQTAYRWDYGVVSITSANPETMINDLVIVAGADGKIAQMATEQREIRTKVAAYVYRGGRYVVVRRPVVRAPSYVVRGGRYVVRGGVGRRAYPSPPI